MSPPVSSTRCSITVSDHFGTHSVSYMPAVVPIPVSHPKMVRSSRKNDSDRRALHGYGVRSNSDHVTSVPPGNPARSNAASNDRPRTGPWLRQHPPVPSAGYLRALETCRYMPVRGSSAPPHASGHLSPMENSGCVSWPVPFGRSLAVASAVRPCSEMSLFESSVPYQSLQGQTPGRDVSQATRWRLGSARVRRSRDIRRLGVSAAPRPTRRCRSLAVVVRSDGIWQHLAMSSSVGGRLAAPENVWQRPAEPTIDHGPGGRFGGAAVGRGPIAICRRHGEAYCQHGRTTVRAGLAADAARAQTPFFQPG